VAVAVQVVIPQDATVVLRVRQTHQTLCLVVLISLTVVHKPLEVALRRATQLNTQPEPLVLVAFKVVRFAALGVLLVAVAVATTAVVRVVFRKTQAPHRQTASAVAVVAALGPVALV
jgi:hypothetical protein